MKQILFLLALVTLCACAAPKSTSPPAETSAPLTISVGPAGGKVTRVNPELKFCVVDFSGRAWPGIGARLNVFRNGEPVGAVILTEPTRGRFVTADIVAGEIRGGDEVR